MTNVKHQIETRTDSVGYLARTAIAYTNPDASRYEVCTDIDELRRVFISKVIKGNIHTIATILAQVVIVLSGNTPGARRSQVRSDLKTSILDHLTSGYGSFEVLEDERPSDTFLHVLYKAFEFFFCTDEMAAVYLHEVWEMDEDDASEVLKRWKAIEKAEPYMAIPIEKAE